jgi:hypothetical protein
MDLPAITPRFAHGAVSAVSAIEFTEASPPAVHGAPCIVAVRLLRGAELPDGRIAGETDRVTHLIPVPAATAMPECLTTFCELAIDPGQAELVAVGTGMPCVPCLIAAPTPEVATGSIRGDGRP